MEALTPVAAAASLALAIAAMSREMGVRVAIAAPVLIGAAALASAALMGLGAPWRAACVLALLAANCFLVAEIDRRSQIIPDALVLAVALLAFAAPFGDSVASRLLGGVLLGGFFLAVRGAFQLMGQQDALGLGDVKFAAALGAFLGPYHGLIAVALAGAATVAMLLWRGRREPAMASSLGAPFGVGLSAALAFLAACRVWGLA